MVRKFALAAVAVVVGAVIADTLTAERHHALANLFGLHDDCPPQRESPGAKRDRPLFTPAVAHSAR